jgi:myo-inositol-1(or 4)-monophosphatase
MFKALHRDSAGIRRAGSAALDLAYVAAGRLDGFWEIGLNPWDMAAGALLILEAGGMVGDFRGSEGYNDSGNIVAGNPKVYQTMLQAIAPFLTPDLAR